MTLGKKSENWMVWHLIVSLTGIEKVKLQFENAKQLEWLCVLTFPNHPFNKCKE